MRAVEPLIVALKDEDGYVRSMAARALGEIKDVRAVEPLIVALKDKDGFLRRWAAEALGKIKDVRAVEPLILAMKDENLFVRRKAAEALGKITIVGTIEPLSAALKVKNLEVIAEAYIFFIQRGESGTEVLLIEALNKYGSKEMAEDFVNCGNRQLEVAGRKWANERNYTIIQLSVGGDSPRWGGR